MFYCNQVIRNENVNFIFYVASIFFLILLILYLIVYYILFMFGFLFPKGTDIEIGINTDHWRSVFNLTCWETRYQASGGRRDADAVALAVAHSGSRT